MNTRSLPGMALAILAGVAPATAGDTSPKSQQPQDKSGYHLFRPTPRELMRELSTDRPDQTESPYTVDAGHVQIEMDFVNHTLDRQGGIHSEAWNVAPVNLKIGLLNNLDVQFLFDGYSWERTRQTAVPKARAEGFGDFAVRLKWNLYGNDGGKTALALMPWVSIPLRASELGADEPEGGLIVPFAIDLGGGWGIGLMTEVDLRRDADSSDLHVEWVNSIAVGRDLTDRLGMYVEFFSVVSEEPGTNWQGQVDVGFTFAVSEDVQLDAGCNFGVTRSAPDFNPFLGVSIRF